MSSNKILLCAALAAAASSAQADVTVTTQTTGKAPSSTSAANPSTRSRARDSAAISRTAARRRRLIIDIDGRRFVSLDVKKKSAQVTPLDSIADELQKVGVGTLDATLKKTSQTKQIAGFPCTVHDINLSLPFSPTGQSGQGMDLTMVLSGTVCLSTAAPGLADYQAFYKAAADSGFIFGDPRTAKSPTGAAQAKAYAALTRKMAEAGMALESHINITASGDNPMASLMASARQERHHHHGHEDRDRRRCRPNPSRFPRTSR